METETKYTNGEDRVETESAPSEACDDQNFNWGTGQQGDSKYLHPAAFPGEDTGSAEKYMKSTGELDIKPVKRLGSIEVRKPKKSEWFRSHEKMFTEVYVIQKESTRDFYVIDLELAREVGEEARAAYLIACISDEGACFLWPILKPRGDAVGLQLYENDLADLSLSRSTWIRRQWAMGPKSYKVDQTNSEKVPEWPQNQNIVDWVNKAFRGRFIDSLDHPLLCRLRGEL
jgi:hypothetical protein